MTDAEALAKLRTEAAERQRAALVQRQEAETRRTEAEAAQQAADARNSKSDEEVRARAEADRQRLAAFDGRWNSVWRRVSGCTVPLARGIFTIKDGRIFGERVINGEVNSSGAIAMTLRNLIPSGNNNRATGMLSGDQGSITTTNVRPNGVTCIGRAAWPRIGR
jgi:multidrug efflux pump subunit AcrA (membrane-fusion protein)